MTPRTVLVLLAVVMVLFVVALVVGLGREERVTFTIPPWAAALGGWLAGEQGVAAGDLRPRSSENQADVACRNALAHERNLTLPENGSCIVVVGSSPRPVRTLGLSLVGGGPADIGIALVDRDDRLTAPRRHSLGERSGADGDQVIRLQFYEEGGNLQLACRKGCTLVVVKPG